MTERGSSIVVHVYRSDYILLPYIIHGNNAPEHPKSRTLPYFLRTERCNRKCKDALVWLNQTSLGEVDQVTYVHFLLNTGMEIPVSIQARCSYRIIWEQLLKLYMLVLNVSSKTCHKPAISLPKKLQQPSVHHIHCGFACWINSNHCFRHNGASDWFSVMSLWNCCTKMQLARVLKKLLRSLMEFLLG